MKRGESWGAWAPFLFLLVGGCQFIVPAQPPDAPAADNTPGADLAAPGDMGELENSPDLAPPGDLATGPDLGFVSSLVGSSVSPPATADLTTVGALDWAHWGFSGNTDFDHKKGANLIGNAVLVGDSNSNGPTQYSDNHVAFTWTNGTPHASATATTTGVWVSGIGNGVQISAPSGTVPRTLQLYISAHLAAGQLVAHLSDGTTADYSDSFSDHSSGTYRLYTFVYRSTGGSLQVTWTQTQSFASDTSANITLQAVTLAP
jgi:hypothetical protein